VYEGWVRHRRYGDVRHELRTRVFMLYLDLDELPALFDDYRFASARGRALAEFRRSDHLGDPAHPLADVIRDRVAAETGTRPAGPIRLLTNLRYFAHCFNPVSFYYCFDGADGSVVAIVAEVTNTPWGEHHAYVLVPDASRAPGSVMRGRFAKQFHVSPFMAMDHSYDWRTNEPAEQLLVHIDSVREGRTAFDATVSLQRHTLTPSSLYRRLARNPLLTVRIVGQIYAHGLRIWMKGAPYFPNPSEAPLLRRRGRGRATSRWYT
jgi:DUF1365 family protein